MTDAPELRYRALLARAPDPGPTQDPPWARTRTTPTPSRTRPVRSPGRRGRVRRGSIRRRRPRRRRPRIRRQVRAGGPAQAIPPSSRWRRSRRRAEAGGRAGFGQISGPRRCPRCWRRAAPCSSSRGRAPSTRPAAGSAPPLTASRGPARSTTPRRSSTPRRTSARRSSGSSSTGVSTDELGGHPETGVGSGVIYDAAGWILTNRHVVLTGTARSPLG